MKRRIWICVVTGVLSFLSLVLSLNLTDPAIAISGEKSAACSQNDSWRFRMALIPKKIDIVGLACPVSESFSVKMGGLTYCLATDDCESIYIPELNLYYSVSRANHDKLHNLFSEYELPNQ